MTRHRFISGIAGIALAMGIGGVIGVQGRAAEADTLQDVTTAGRLAGQDINRLTADLTQQSAKADPKTKAAIEGRLAAIRKIQPVINKLERDPNFAKQVLEAAGKGQPEGVASVLSRELGTPIRATDLRDFYFLGGFSLGGTKYDFCVSTTKACTGEDGTDGHNFILQASR